ncbi:MAG: Uncharacterised protein [Synechococcus sp. MIT S9220]|nr:MAG: Uncharacterised protein [Synechococcus sp. MIT S9220]
MQIVCSAPAVADLVPQPDDDVIRTVRGGAVAGRVDQMPLEELQQQFAALCPPLQMGGRADVEFRSPSRRSGLFRKSNHAAEMGIPPAPK